MSVTSAPAVAERRACRRPRSGSGGPARGATRNAASRNDADRRRALDGRAAPRVDGLARRSSSKTRLLRGAPPPRRRGDARRRLGLLLQQKAGARRPGGGRRRPLARRRPARRRAASRSSSVTRTPHSSRPATSSNRRASRLPGAREVRDGARIAREQREELHRDDGARTAPPLLDDGLVRDRAPGDPVEIAEALLDRPRRRTASSGTVATSSHSLRPPPGGAGPRRREGREPAPHRRARLRPHRAVHVGGPLANLHALVSLQARRHCRESAPPREAAARPREHL